jgi:hypothetical protein
MILVRTNHLYLRVGHHSMHLLAPNIKFSRASSCLAHLSRISSISSRYSLLLSVAGIFVCHNWSFSISIHSQNLQDWNKWISRRGQRIYGTVWNLNKNKKLPPYHKARVCIDTLKVTPPSPVSAISLPQVNCIRTMACALRPLIPRRKEVLIWPPIRFIIPSPITRSWSTWRYHNYELTLEWEIICHLLDKKM